MSEKGAAGGQAGGPGAKPPAQTKSHPAPAVVALRMEDVTHWAIERVAKMPREHKFAIGDKLVEACLDVTCGLVEATYVRDKLALLSQASRGLVRARVLARLASRSKLLSLDQLAYFERETVDVGRMIGGWTRSMRRR